MSRWASVLVLAHLCGCHNDKMSSASLSRLHQECLTLLKEASAGEPSAQLRSEALLALRLADSVEVAPWIQRGLFDPNERVRAAACIGLGRMSSMQSAPSVDRMLSDRSPLVRICAKLSLAVDQAAELEDELCKLIGESPDLLEGEVGLAAVSEIISHASGVQVDCARAEDPSGIGQPGRAVLAFGAARGDPAITRELLFRASSGEESSRIRAIEILGFSPEHKVLYTLLDLLKDCTYLEGRLAAANSLTRFERADGLGLAVDTLIESIERGLQYGLEQTARIRILACRVCGNVGNVETLNVLADLLAEDINMRVRIVCAGAVLKIIADEDRVLVDL